MSLILEALRKSEAERRLGQAPDVLAPMVMAVAPPARPRRGVGVIVGITAAALLAVVGGVAWWAMRLAPNCSEPSQAACAPPASPPVALTTTAPTPVSVPTPSSALDSATPTPAARSSITAASPAPSTAASPAIAPVPDATAPKPPAIVSPRPDKKPNPPAALATATTQAASLPSFATAPPLPTTAPASPPAATSDDAPALLPITSLPASERDALPPLKVTMHAYSADPARRFMIVDGQRIGEGGRIGDGIVLIHIRRDGAEIDVRGRRLLLPNP